ncbi:MAG: MmcQ/YjbR family DNA-binding protein [Alphaproteobacteria bacterium]|nr:MmcQ/YjbR family DNA-binding protein [Alphaproteobacteria bacterium]
MHDETEFFKDKKADAQQLISFGFSQEGAKYLYQQPIVDGIFILYVLMDGASVFTNIMDVQSNTEYCLHNIPGADGKFVGKVRMEYERILTNIREQCFTQYVFKTRMAEAVINFAYERFGDRLEFLWDKLPTAAILRHKVSRKWYAIFMKISAQKLGLDYDSHIEILNLKVEAEIIAKIVDRIKFFPAYHMNKRSWITVNLNEIDNISEITSLILESYASVS